MSSAFDILQPQTETEQIHTTNFRFWGCPKVHFSSKWAPCVSEYVCVCVCVNRIVPFAIFVLALICCCFCIVARSSQQQSTRRRQQNQSERMQNGRERNRRPKSDGVQHADSSIMEDEVGSQQETG